MDPEREYLIKKLDQTSTALAYLVGALEGLDVISKHTSNGVMATMNGKTREEYLGTENEDTEKKQP